MKNRYDFFFDTERLVNPDRGISSVQRDTNF